MASPRTQGSRRRKMTCPPTTRHRTSKSAKQITLPPTRLVKLPSKSERNIFLPRIPAALEKRKLPALPISKRKLPTLPPTLLQSRSKSISKSNETESKSWPNSPMKKNSKQNSSFRNLFSKSLSNIHKRLFTGSKTNSELADVIDTRDAFEVSDWRPSLDCICSDSELLNALTVYSTKQYNEENILFLQDVNDLNKSINDLLLFNDTVNIVQMEKINVAIENIFRTYVENDSDKQINVSFDCCNKTMQKHQKFREFPLSEKTEIFSRCCQEIKSLIHKSVLYTFYNDDMFQSIALSRNIRSNEDYLFHKQSSVHKQGMGISEEYDSDDAAYEDLTGYGSAEDDYFDVFSANKWNVCNKYMLSSKGFALNSGYHEWQIKIIKTNNHRQEFGVCSHLDKNIEMNEFGILDTPLFGARAVYGFNNLPPTFYYGSYNKNNTVRCNKDLSQLNMHSKGRFEAGDVIKICLNVSRSWIKFYLNGKQVRKCMSIEKDTIYYPILSYNGDCEFKVIS